MTTGTIVLNVVLSVATTAIVGGTAFLVPFRLDRTSRSAARLETPSSYALATRETRLAA